MMGMTDQGRHLTAISIAAAVAIAGSVFKVCDQQLYMIAAAIIGGEYGLARSAPSAPTTVTGRVDHPVTINQQERRE